MGQGSRRAEGLTRVNRTTSAQLSAGLVARLASPCCVADLDELTCRACGRTFPTVAGVPALFDFERSVVQESSLSATAAASPISRSARGRLRRLFDGGNPIAEGNADTMAHLLPTDARILVVGGATVGKGLEALYDGRFEVVGFDIYASEHTQLLADAHQIPFAEQTFDAVIVQAVLEHVLEPQVAVDEIWRVLKRNGLVYAETPFLQQVHEGAYDFTRFTESGHRWLFKRFARIDSGVVAGPAYTLLWTIDYLIRALTRSRRAGLRARKVAIPVRFLDRWVDRRFAVDSASAVFFLGRRSNEVISPRDAIAHYMGAQ